MHRLAPLGGVAVRAIVSCVPRGTQTTRECPAFSSIDEADRFAGAVGIKERRIAGPMQCASDLCAWAAEGVLERLGWERSSVGMLVMVTQSPDYGSPGNGILLQHRLNLRQNIIAFDINLGCSAFPFGLAQMVSTMASLGIERGLLLIGDVSSRGCNPKDPSSYPLFGDAGAAIAFELDPKAGQMFFDLNSDGSGGEAIFVKSSGIAGRYPIGPKSHEINLDGDDGHPRSDLNTRLKGADIFSFSIQKAPQSIRNVLYNAGLERPDIDYLVLHQANKMINDLVCRKTGFSGGQVLSSLDVLGNTGSASIAVTLCATNQTLQSTKVLLACGFGVGLSWGSVVFKLEAGTPLALIESDDTYRPDLLFAG
jgi:3-oxoacyl-[acyl-carrier-protein] synthase III